MQCGTFKFALCIEDATDCSQPRQQTRYKPLLGLLTHPVGEEAQERLATVVSVTVQLDYCSICHGTTCTSTVTVAVTA